MSDVDFYRTAMGRQFYERTVPRLADELARLNERLQAVVELLQDLRDTRAAARPGPGDTPT